MTFRLAELGNRKESTRQGKEAGYSASSWQGKNKPLSVLSTFGILSKRHPRVTGSYYDRHSYRYG